MKYEIVKGNTVECSTDAVVLPANEQLLEGQGTSHAIFSAVGRKQLKSACEALKKPVEIGLAVPTSGYNLKASFIIHAVVPAWGDGARCYGR